MSAVRHTSRTHARVLQLHTAGWEPGDIRRLLHQEGLPVPSRSTLWDWTHPQAARTHQERHRQQTRAARAETGTYAWAGVRGPEWKLHRMLRLHAAGLSCAAVATVMSHDFPATPISPDQADRAIRDRQPAVAHGAPRRPYTRKDAP